MRKEEKPHMPKPDEHEGMPHHKHSLTALLQSVAKIGTQSTMKSIKTLHEFLPHIPHDVEREYK
jgi:hypothetical protein